MVKHTLIFALLSLQSCKEPASTSAVNFKLTGQAGLTQYADLPEVLVCTNSMNRAEDIRTTTLTWYRAIKSQTPNVIVVQSDAQYDSKCHASVKFKSLGGAPSYTTITSTPDIHMNADSTWYNSNAILSHEFGHAFGLSDTYSPTSGMSGDCQDGQPQQAVMCTPQYGSPQPDDISGLRQIYGSDDGSNPNVSQLPGGANGQTYNPINQGNAVNPVNSSNPGNLGYSNDSQPATSTGGAIQGDLLVGVLQSLAQGFNAANAVNGIEFNPRQRLGDQYCKEGLRAQILDDSSESAIERGKILAIVSALPARTMTVCLGDPLNCGSPHAYRLVAQPQRGSQADGSKFLVRFDAKVMQILRDKRLQEDKSREPMVMIEGILEAPDGRLVRMGCPKKFQ